MSGDMFHGCKLALLHDRQVLVYERDDHVKHAGMWDLPGGGRQGDESPEACVLRELVEEFGLQLAADRLVYRRRYAGAGADAFAWFFVGYLSRDEVEAIRFGDEGQRWMLMEVGTYLVHSQALRVHQSWLREYFGSTDARRA